MSRDFHNNTKVTLVCETCGATTRRRLLNEVACRGTRETSSEPALCPRGHGLMVRKDGHPNTDAQNYLRKP